MIGGWVNLFTNKKFIFIWFSQILSQISLNILNFSILFNLFENTGSSIATSFVWISYAIPSLLIGPTASVLVDMYDRKLILIITNLMQSFLIFMYAFIPFTSHYFIYSVVIIYSTINQFYVPAELASLPSLAGKKLLPEANSISFLTQQASLIIGFGGAGLINNLLGFHNTIILCSSLMFLAFISTCYLPRLKTARRIYKRIDEIFNGFVIKIKNGYKFISKNKFIMAPLLILICMQVSLAIIAVNAPAITKEIVNIPLSFSGLLFIVPGGIGSLVSSFLISRLIQNGTRKIKLIKYFLIYILISLCLFVFLVPLLETYTKYIVIFLLISVIGFSYIGIVIPAQTFLQQETPAKLRGRVFGNYWFLVNTISMLPVILSGTISEVFGSKVLLIIIASGILLLYVFLKSKEKKYLLPEGYN